MEYYRFLTDRVLGGKKRSPVVLVVGARQSGKSFLMKVMSRSQNTQYTTFDNLPTLAAAQHDPIGFLKNLSKPIILDEIQRVPELFLAIKEDVDENRNPGRYTLTGSANPLMVPKLGDSLAGRMLLYKLYPLSQGEIQEKKENFLEAVFADEFPIQTEFSFSKSELIEKLCIGGYPEVQNLHNHEERSEWADAYLSLILQKDIQDLSRVEGLTQLPNLLVTLAAQIGSLLSYENLAKGSSIPKTTLRRYFQLLDSLFIVQTLPPWSRNIKKRLVKSPKVYFVDTLILLQLLNYDANRLRGDLNILGKATENFVYLELVKQTTWNTKKIKLFHFRTQSQAEIDLVLEDERGKIVGIEVKSSETVSADDFKHFHHLKEAAGKDFLRGIVLYAGQKILPFGKDLIALPISALWDAKL